MKIVTWNVNSINSRITHLDELIKQHNPDIICLQELKCKEESFPMHDAFTHYNIYLRGQKSYNGVAILSKHPADEINYDFKNNPLADEARFIEIVVKTDIGLCRIISLYAPNGQAIGSDKFANKIKFYQEFTKYIEERRSYDEMLFIAGDFNIAPENIDVYDPVSMELSVCFSKQERAIIRSIINKYSLQDQHRVLHPDEHNFSWWDYRQGAFAKNLGLRIDYILASPNASNLLTRSYIDTNARSKDKPSDHAPVFAEYML